MELGLIRSVVADADQDQGEWIRDWAPGSLDASLFEWAGPFLNSCDPEACDLCSAR